jgi:hypothetical protein
MESMPETIQELLHLLQQSARENDSGQKFQLQNGQFARLTFSDKAEEGYARAVVSTELPSEEQATIAALVALRGRETDPRQGRLALGAAQWLPELLGGLADGTPQPQIPPALRTVDNLGVLTGLGLGYIKNLLRHYRPDFDEMSELDQRALLARVAEKTNKFLKALRELAACLQYGDPYEGLPTSPVRMADRDVRAAQMRDIESLTYVEIGRKLGVKQSDNDAVRGDNYRVRVQIVPNGRKILKRVLGERGYEEFVDANKAEYERRNLLSPERQFAEICAEFCSISADRIHRVITADEETFLEEVEGLDNNETEILMLQRDWWKRASANHSEAESQ